MPDFIVHTLAWMLSLCTPRPRGRHRLGTLPPLRIIPVPPPPSRCTELLHGNASRLVRPYVLDPAEHRRQRDHDQDARPATPGIRMDPKHAHHVPVPAATR